MEAHKSEGGGREHQPENHFENSEILRKLCFNYSRAKESHVGMEIFANFFAVLRDVIEFDVGKHF